MNNVVLWSHSQRCFHIEPVTEMLEKNRNAFDRKRPSDYVPLYIGTDADCQRVLHELMMNMPADLT